VQVSAADDKPGYGGLVLVLVGAALGLALLTGLAGAGAGRIPHDDSPDDDVVTVTISVDANRVYLGTGTSRKLSTVAAACEAATAADAVTLYPWSGSEATVDALRKCLADHKVAFDILPEGEAF
jgi:hypothetical protein